MIAGCGVALLRAASALDKFQGDDVDETTGGKIVARALQSPIRQIAENSGLEPSVVVQKVLSSPGNVGLNAETGEFVDLFKAGIVDPLKVTRTALENAVSLVGTFLTTEVLVADIPEKKEPAMPGQGGEGGMY